jgi:membrane protein
VTDRHLTAWTLLREGVNAFLQDNALTRGAAIAFYAVTAIAPVLFIATAIAALGLGESAASGAVHYQLRRIMSQESADLVQGAILHARAGHHGVAGSIIGLTALVVTASGFFTEVEDALNVIWQAPRHESYFQQLLRGRILGLMLVVVLGVLLLLSMLIATGARFVGHFFDNDPIPRALVQMFNLGLSLLVVALLFAAIYKLLPNCRLRWRDVLAGACGSAVLFVCGQTLIDLYLSRIITASIYGAAGGMIVLSIWVYYSAQIFLLGAEFTKIWAQYHGGWAPQRPAAPASR